MNELLRLAACPLLALQPHETQSLSTARLEAMVTDEKARLMRLYQHNHVSALVNGCNTWLSAYDLDKRMRAALTRAADGINATCDLLNTGFGAAEEDMVDMRECARDCAALAKEGVK